MSHIPNAAMPHTAAHDEPAETPVKSRRAKVADKASELAGKAQTKVKDNPRTAIAAGAAVVAAAVAAAAIPAVKAARKKSTAKRSPAKSKAS